MTSKNALCIITKNADADLDFYNNITMYDVYIIIDNNYTPITNLIKQYSNLNFIKMDNDYVESKNYINSSSIYLNFNKVIGWDKALLFFNELTKYKKTTTLRKYEYNFIWFLENDVWFFDETTLLNIDNKYFESDLLTNKYGEKDNELIWPWNVIKKDGDFKYYKSLICGCRFSQKMIESIDEYVNEFKTLLFIEIMFPTLAFKNNLIYHCPDELNKILYQYDFVDVDFNKIQLFHPVKNIEKQKLIRNNISSIPKQKRTTHSKYAKYAKYAKYKKERHLLNMRSMQSIKKINMNIIIK
jgi:hypothetical protein